MADFMIGLGRPFLSKRTISVRVEDGKESRVTKLTFLSYSCVNRAMMI